MSGEFRCASCPFVASNSRSLNLHISWSLRRLPQYPGEEVKPHLAWNGTDGGTSLLSRPHRSIYNSRSSGGDEVTRIASPNLLEVQNGVMYCGACESPGEMGTSDLPFSSPDSTCSIHPDISSQDPDPSSSPDPDVSLLEKVNKYVESGHGTTTLSSLLEYEIKLLQILKPYPLKLYQDISKLVHDSRVSQVDLLSIPRKRQAVLKELKTRFNMEAAHPKVINFLLPGCNQRVDLVVHDIKDLLYSLLTDPVVMRDENLLFHGNHPFEPPPDLDDRDGEYLYADVNDGSVYYDAYHTHCKVDKRDVLAAVLAFVDKTHTDVSNSRLCMEPFSITLSIFKKKARTKAMFWRSLGYVVNQSHLIYKNASTMSVDKARDYHLMLEYILQSLVDVQKGGGIAWQLPYMGVTHEVVFKLPLMFVSGDTEGHDKLVGKYLSRCINVARLCRYCDCPTPETSNPKYNFTLTKATEIEELVSKGDTECLKSISYHCIPNGFRQVQFCDPVYGINGATPAELLHTWQKGLFVRFLASLFGQKRLKKVASKRKKSRQPNNAASANLNDIADDLDESEIEDGDSDGGSEEEFEEDVMPTDDPDFDESFAAQAGYKVPSENDLSRVGVFTDSVKADFDDLAKRYGRCLQHQSDRSFCRAFFPAGITSNCKKNAHEEQLVLILCHIILVSSKGSYFDDALDGSVTKGNRTVSTNERSGQRSVQFIELISMLIYIENFFKQSTFTRKQILDFKDFMVCFLVKYSAAVGRVDGNGMNFIKFHLPLHAADDILRFGPPMSFDSSTGESNHKVIKGSSRQTQRNTKKFEEQTAGRAAENLLIDRAHRSLCPPPSLVSSEVSSESEEGAPICSDATFYVTEKGLFCNKNQDASKLLWHDKVLLERISKLITHQIIPNLQEGARVQLFTKFKKSPSDDATIYRAHPSYGKELIAWHDWALIDWHWDEPNPQELGKIPGRLMIFFEISTTCKIVEPISFDYCIISEPGVYVILQSLVESPYVEPPTYSFWSDSVFQLYGKIKNYLAQGNSSLMYWSCLEMEEADQGPLPKLRVFNVHSIHSPLVAVPYDLDKFERGLDQEQWLIIDPVEQWMVNFVREMEDVIKEAQDI